MKTVSDFWEYIENDLLVSTKTIREIFGIEKSDLDLWAAKGYVPRPVLEQNYFNMAGLRKIYIFVSATKKAPEETLFRVFEQVRAADCFDAAVFRQFLAEQLHLTKQETALTFSSFDLTRRALEDWISKHFLSAWESGTHVNLMVLFNIYLICTESVKKRVGNCNFEAIKELISTPGILNRLHENQARPPQKLEGEINALLVRHYRTPLIITQISARLGKPEAEVLPIVESMVDNRKLVRRGQGRSATYQLK